MFHEAQHGSADAVFYILYVFYSFPSILASTTIT